MARRAELLLSRGSMLPSETGSADFLKSLGFPTVEIHDTFTHFDFTTPGRRVLLVGPMGSGKTEAAARVWRDAAVARSKSGKVLSLTSSGDVDRRNVFFVRSILDKNRFSEYPPDALAYRGGYVSCGDHIAFIRDSFDLEAVIRDNPRVGTYIIDEASFFDERLAYVVRSASLEKGIMWVFPTLVLNFRREFFNATARLMLDIATDVVPLTAYCEHPDCLMDAFYTYRYYMVEGKECPALYFDPLIVVGGDKKKQGDLDPNYGSRCDQHHYLPGKEYAFLTLKPLGQDAAKGEGRDLVRELERMRENVHSSLLYQSLMKSYGEREDGQVYLHSLCISRIAEKALCWLFSEQNVIGEELLRHIVTELGLDAGYMAKVLSDSKRPVNFEQMLLL